MSKTTDKVIDLLEEDLHNNQNGYTKKVTKEVGNYDFSNKKNISKSLAQFQIECPTIKQSTKGYNYTYADLVTILNEIRPILFKNGLTFTHLFEGDYIVLVLIHFKSGETIVSKRKLNVDVDLKSQNALQVEGSSITYNRRYTLSSLLGIVTDEDGDGVVGRKSPTYNKPKPKPKAITKTKLPRDKFEEGVKAIEKLKDPTKRSQAIQNALNNYILDESQRMLLNALKDV